MKKTKKRGNHRRVATKYLPNAILYHLREFYKENHTKLLVAIGLALTWLGGFVLGVSFALGNMGGI
jgi:hypothetical protein